MNIDILYERFLHQEIDRYYFNQPKECRGCREMANPRIEDGLGRLFCCESCLEGFNSDD